MSLEVCLLGYCKESSIFNYSRINFVYEDYSSKGVAWIASDTIFKATSKLTYNFTYKDLNDASQSLSQVDQIQGLSYGVLLTVGGCYRADPFFDKYFNYYLCSAYPTGYDGSYSGTSVITINDSPLLAPEVDRNFRTISVSYQDDQMVE